MTEHQLQAAIIGQARILERQYPALAGLHAVPNGEKRHISVAKRLKAEGVKSGVPDLCLPVARRGYFGLYRECKTGKGATSPIQKWWLQFLETEGYSVDVWRDVDAAMADLLSYVRGPRTKVDFDAED